MDKKTYTSGGKFIRLEPTLFKAFEVYLPVCTETPRFFRWKKNAWAQKAHYIFGSSYEAEMMQYFCLLGAILYHIYIVPTLQSARYI